MSKILTHWRQNRRFHSTARALRALTPKQLRAHGIRPSDIDRLACQAARVPWK
jgi:uncharacterized protein YjiS (DUF1127 family)